MEKKNNKLKKIFIGVSIAVGVLALGFIGLIALLFSAVDSEKASAIDEEKKQAVVQPKTYKVGDTINYKGLEVTIVSAEFTPPAEYGEPEKGKVLTVTVDAVNNTDDDAWVENINFAVYDAEGSATDFYYSYDESAISTKLSAGKKVSGKVYFDVPESSSYELIYSPSVMTFDDAEDIKIAITP